jgi:hypothetical protein
MLALAVIENAIDWFFVGKRKTQSSAVARPPTPAITLIVVPSLPTGGADPKSMDRGTTARHSVTATSTPRVVVVIRRTRR